MISRVYTPLVAPYPTSRKGGKQGAVGSSTEEPRRPFRLPSEDAETPASQPQNPGDAATRPSAGLKSVQVNPEQKIPLSAVLDDFQNTMNALGADEQTRAEVMAYLNTVGLQATKERPEVPFIKQSLRMAAGTLDGFIGKALKQPSHVVREWVDALLMQDIEYQTDAETLKKTLPGQTTAVAETPASTTQADLPTEGFGTAEKSRLKQLIQTAQEQAKAGQFEAAHTKLEDALNLLAEKEQPALTGKVWHLKGRFYEKAGDWQQAVAAYEHAATQFETAGDPQKQARSLHAMASLFETRQQTDRAIPLYQQVVAIDQQMVGQTGDLASVVHSLNDLGSAYLRHGDATQAAGVLEEAARQVKTANLSSLAQSDIWSNLGSAYRAQRNVNKAMNAYQQALELSRAGKDKARYKGILTQLGAMLTETGQHEKAMKVLQRLQGL